MSTNIGTRTIYPNKKIKILNTDILKAKKTRKVLKTEFNSAFKANHPDTIEIKEKYFKAQKQLRELIEHEHQDKIRKITSQLIKEG